MSVEAGQPHETVPRLILLAAGGMIALTLALVGYNQYGGAGSDQPVRAAAVETRELHFEERADGKLAVYAGRDGPLLDLAGPQEKGFLRVAFSALKHGRRVRGITEPASFTLVSDADGGLTLEDPLTGQSIDLRAFGPVNTRAFVTLLPSRSAMK